MEADFWPSPDVHPTIGTALINVAALPILPFIPLGWEAHLTEYDNTAARRDGESSSGSGGSQSTTSPPPLLVWLHPSGRFTLSLLATFALATLTTNLPPNNPSGVHDLALLLFLIGMLQSEVEQLRRLTHLGRGHEYPGWAYADGFRYLDASLMALIASLLISRFLFPPPPEQSAQPPAFALGCQALLALTAWLRVLQGFAVLQSTHSLLAIARRLLSELLKPFLLVTGIITLGFAAAFHILIPRAAPVIAVGEDGDTLAAQPTYATGMLPMIVAASSAVLILLSLMLARSASIIQSIGTRGLAASTHLAFARVCIESRTKGPLPPPFNLLRVVVNWARNGLVNAMRKSEVAMEESSSWMWKRLTDIADDDESHQGGSEEEEEARAKRRAMRMAMQEEASMQQHEVLWRQVLEEGVGGGGGGSSLPTEVERYVSSHPHHLYSSGSGGEASSSAGPNRRASVGGGGETEPMLAAAGMETPGGRLRITTVAEAEREAEQLATARASAEKSEAQHQRLVERLDKILPRLLEATADEETLSAQLDRRLKGLERTVEGHLESQQRSIDARLERLGLGLGSPPRSPAPAAGESGEGAGEKETYVV